MGIIDYAQHLIKIESMIKDVHGMSLNRDYSGAYELIPPILVELRLLSATLAIMQNDTTR